MSLRFAENYDTDENIHMNAIMITKHIKALTPDYLEIEKLANNIIKYCKQGIKYNDRQQI